ncbi:AraC family transcriptional regulator [Paenibacillus pasadenensis]|uniref:AraC family transcriptional regulator n=1 Tax=Paenibacillus pasadenensis TaxID=217090 RepID=UPI00040C979A|nr:AraC family transcriptional regulator [Paenibacillus pasadenensis]
MDWSSKMNDAVDCLESGLRSEVSYAEAARRAGCPAYHFQRMFSYLAGMTLADYVRRRRLTLAAADLQAEGGKVIDVALRYGYESPEAFARAFRQQHGLAPSEARRPGARLRAFPRLAFRFEAQGGSDMNYRMERLPAFRAIGMGASVPTSEAFAEVPQLWQKAAAEGAFARFLELGEPGGRPPGILGICAGGSWGQGERFDYILACVSRETAPEGWRELSFPASQWAVFEAAGPPEALQDVWSRFYREWVPSAGYELAALPAVEAYLAPEENRNELWIPVVGRAGD